MLTVPYVSVAPKLYTHTHPYGHYRKIRSKPKHRDKQFALAITTAIALLVALIVPLAVILPEKYIVKLPISIIVPLYIYPEPGQWDRLYHSIIKHPELNFTIILNPSSGPGTPPYPGSLYIEAIKRLSAFSNVQTVGYIDTERGTRASKTVNNEVEIYSGWSQQPQLSLNGIFFDQTPRIGTLEEKHYLQNISATVKNSANISAPHLMIHNPGGIPNSAVHIAHVDITVVFEGAFEKVPTHNTLKRQLKDLSSGRESYAVFVHSLPTDLGRPRLRKLINGLKKDVQHIFVTDLSEKVYEGFGSVWEEFLDLTW